MGVALSLGVAFVPLGCGGSRGGFDPAAPGQGDAEVPEGVALKLRTCAAEHRAHLPGSAEYSVSFDVKLSSDGEVDSVALRESTLGDEDLEACMAHALRALSVADLPMRRSDSISKDPVAPPSRGLLGQAQALPLVCLASPPCLLTAVIVVGVAIVAVEVVVLASSTTKPKPQTAPTATAVPTSTTTTADIDCKKVKQDCIEKCSDTALPTPDFGVKFRRCMRACMEAKGCVY